MTVRLTIHTLFIAILVATPIALTTANAQQPANVPSWSELSLDEESQRREVPVRYALWTTEVLKQPADGYTLLSITAPFAAIPGLVPDARSSPNSVRPREGHPATLASRGTPLRGSQGRGLWPLGSRLRGNERTEVSVVKPAGEARAASPAASIRARASAPRRAGPRSSRLPRCRGS
jgi:hypothetical protein